MISRIVGDKSQFAIEFSPGSSQKLAYIKIWFNNLYIGAEEEVYFSYVQGALNYILESKDKLANFPYESGTATSILDKVLKNKVASTNKYIMKGFGESFDDFVIVCFYANGKVNFVWRLIENPYFAYDAYPSTAQVARLDFDAFSKIVSEFNSVLLQTE